MTALTACPAELRRLDAEDPLRSLRELFELPQGVIYLDGNSLGPLPRAAPQRVADAVSRQWGQGLIRSWNSAGWFDMPQRLGDKIATLVGADPGEVVATDSTSINLYKVLSAALHGAERDHPGRKILLSERSNFPTDLYIAQSLCAQRGLTLKLIEPEEIDGALNVEVAVLMLTHVNYRTGAMHDMAEVNRKARLAGALTVWDLAHSAGAVPLELKASGADFAVGCGYKFLNGGPGAPAFVWIHPRHSEQLSQPLSGWWSHAAPFAFTPEYQPAKGITRYLCGTQPILSMVALDAGLDTLLAARDLAPAGQPMVALRAKSLALSDCFIQLVEQHCQGLGLRLITPRNHKQRGSEVSWALDVPAAVPSGSSAYAVMQALIARGVIGDFRAGDGDAQPDILRFGITPMYLRFADIWNAVEHLRQVLQGGEWQRPEFARKQAVT